MILSEIRSSADKLLGFSLKIYWTNLKLPLIKDYGHVVVKCTQYFELLSSVIGENTIGSRFLVVEIGNFEVILRTKRGDHPNHWIKVQWLILFHYLDASDSLSVIGQSAVDFLHACTAQEYHSALLTPDCDKFILIVFSYSLC